MFELDLVIDELPELPNRLQRKHWSRIQGHRTLWHWRVRSAVARKGPGKPLDYAMVTMVRHSTRRPDRDNLWASWKPVLDGLVQCGVLIDDDDDHVDFHGGGWEPAKRKQQRVTIEVREVRSPNG